MEKKKGIVIVGATSAIAEHCARLWLVREPVNLILIGRDALRTERVAADLRVRSPLSDIHTMTTNFLNPITIRTAVDSIMSRHSIDQVLIAHGSLPDQINCQNDLMLCRDALEINATSPVLFAEAFAGHFSKAGQGTLALIGSVAGDRGRKSNYVYGAAKGLVTRYAQGLQHRFAGTPVRVVIVKPGPTDTPMTAQLKNRGVRLAPVEMVAQRIVNAIEARSEVVYAPAIWRLIMWVTRHLPSVVFNKLRI